jgi:hypothetical protein
MIHLKLLQKQKQNKYQTSRKKEIIMIRAEIIEIKTKKHYIKIDETKS